MLDFTNLANLPDIALLNDAQVCALGGFSRDTLFRLDKRGEGPLRVRISERRFGRPVGEFRKWLKARAVPSAAA